MFIASFLQKQLLILVPFSIGVACIHAILTGPIRDAWIQSLTYRTTTLRQWSFSMFHQGDIRRNGYICLAIIAEVTSSYFAGSIYIYNDPEINGYISQGLFSNNIKEESVDGILCFRGILTWSWLSVIVCCLVCARLCSIWMSRLHVYCILLRPWVFS